MGHPVSFATPAALRAWLSRHHARADELILRVWKVHAAARGVTNKQAVDEALCFGWIDGVRHTIDADSFRVRFTPRRARSFWSAVNIRRVGELEALGRMTAAGRAAFAARTAARSGVYAFEQPPVELDAAALRALRAVPAAHAFWEARPPWYRRASAHWVVSAKQEATRTRRLAVLVDCCARGVAIPPLGDRIGGKQAVATKKPAKTPTTQAAKQAAATQAAAKRPAKPASAPAQSSRSRRRAPAAAAASRKTRPR